MSSLSLITDLFRQYPVTKIGHQDHQQSRVKETFMQIDCTTLERWHKFLKYLQSKWNKKQPSTCVWNNSPL